MKVRFTLALSDRTVRAFSSVEGCDAPEQVKDLLLETLKERVAEVREQADEDES